MKQVKLTENTNTLLDEIKYIRKESGQLIKTKQDIIAELVLKAYKKECKK